MVCTMPSTRRRRASSISVTSDAGALSTGSPNVRMGNVDTLSDYLGGRIPETDGAPPVFVAEDADGSGVEGEAARLLGRQAQVGHGQHPQDVAVGEEEHVAVPVLRVDVVDEALAPGGCAVQRLAAGRTVGEEVPPGSLGADVVTRPPLVLAVVDLGEQVGDLRHLETGQARRLNGPVSGAGQHAQGRDFEAPEPLGEEPGPLLALTREGDVGAAGVAPVARPLGLPVANENETLPLS